MDPQLKVSSESGYQKNFKRMNREYFEDKIPSNVSIQSDIKENDERGQGMRNQMQIKGAYAQIQGDLISGQSELMGISKI